MRLTTMAIILLGAVAVDFSPLAAQSASIYQRQTSVQATIMGSRGRYDGGFGATGTSSICGEIPKEASLSGEAAFNVEFPSEISGNQTITAVAFGSKQLAGGISKASVFRLMVGVRLANGGRPPNYVLNTDTPKNTGSATLTRQGAAITLKVVGQNDAGESIDLTVICS